MSRHWYTRPFKPIGDWMVWLGLMIFSENDTGWSFDRSSRTVYAEYSEPRTDRDLGSEEAIASMLPLFWMMVYGFSITAVADVLQLWVLVPGLLVWLAIGMGAVDVIGDITVEQEVHHDT